MIMTIFKPEEIDKVVYMLDSIQYLDVYDIDEIHHIIEEVIQILVQENVNTF